MSDLKPSATQAHNGNGLLSQAENHSRPMAKTVIKHYGRCIPTVNKPRLMGVGGGCKTVINHHVTSIGKGGKAVINRDIT